MITTDIQGFKVLEFEIFQEHKRLKHGINLRDCGINEQNLEILEQALPNKIVLAKQVHKTEIIPLSKQERSTNYVCDGFLTNQQEVVLGVKHADCQSAIFYDPIHHAIANIHCGWRGNVENIYEKTVLLMKELYLSKPENLFVGIGPSLGPNHAEFTNYKKELPEEFWDYKDRYDRFNLWKIAEKQLLDLGICEHNIEISRLCTYSNKNDFYSYRRENNEPGRHITFCYLT